MAIEHFSVMVVQGQSLALSVSSLKLRAQEHYMTKYCFFLRVAISV